MVNHPNRKLIPPYRLDEEELDILIEVMRYWLDNTGRDDQKVKALLEHFEIVKVRQSPSFRIEAP